MVWGARIDLAVVVSMEYDHTELGRLLYAFSQSAPLSVESNFVPVDYVSFARNNYFIPLVAITLYLMFCFGGKYIMEGRRSFDLRLPLALWNALLSLFSFLGMVRTVSE